MHLKYSEQPYDFNQPPPPTKSSTTPTITNPTTDQTERETWMKLTVANVSFGKDVGIMKLLW
jgi:hypothetical protein